MRVEATTPYSWPYDQRIAPASTALVICGTGRRWARRTPIDEAAEANIGALRALAADVGLLTVVLTHEVPTRDAGSPRSTDERLEPELPVRPCTPLVASSREHEIRAAGTDGFYGSPLDRVLHQTGRSHLLLAGFGFETAVHSTLRRANDRGYECLTVADACLSIDASLRPASISTIELSGGIFGAVGSTSQVITAFWAANDSSPSLREERR